MKIEPLRNILYSLSFLSELGSDVEKKADLLFDQISGLKSPSSSMGTVSKISTAEEQKQSVFAPTPTDFPEKEEDYNWRTSKINISGMSFSCYKILSPSYYSFI